MLVNLNTAMSGYVRCLRQNIVDPESRASGDYWIDSSWIDERFRLYGWPQLAIFQVGSSAESEKSGIMVYFPRVQVDIFASGEIQKNSIADAVKKATLRTYRTTLANSGIMIDSLEGEVDSIEDERVPLKSYRKTLLFSTLICDSGA